MGYSETLGGDAELTVDELIELLSELPGDLPVMVKNNRTGELVDVRGVLYAERRRDGFEIACLRFEGDWTRKWVRGISTPHEEWGPRFKRLEMREPKRLTSRLTERAQELLPVQELVAAEETENRYVDVRVR